MDCLDNINEKIIFDVKNYNWINYNVNDALEFCNYIFINNIYNTNPYDYMKKWSEYLDNKYIIPDNILFYIFSKYF
jgi:hypothetical protein